MLHKPGPDLLDLGEGIVGRRRAAGPLRVGRDGTGGDGASAKDARSRSWTTSQLTPGAQSASGDAVAHDLVRSSSLRSMPERKGRCRVSAPLGQDIPRQRRGYSTDVPDQATSSSTRPQACAVAASMGRPEKASHAVRRRPMRRGRLTVPPAPGTRPRPISGSAICVSGAATHGVGEGGELDARTHARAMQVGHRRRPQPGEHAPDAALQADDVRRGRVRPGAELVEVAAGAEGVALAPQLDPVDIGVGGGKRQRFGELVAHQRVERVAASGTRQGDGEDPAVAVHPDPWPVVPSRCRGAMRRPPGRELGSGLQDGVRRRLGDETLADGQAVLCRGAAGPAWWR